MASLLFPKQLLLETKSWPIVGVNTCFIIQNGIRDYNTVDRHTIIYLLKVWVWISRMARRTRKALCDTVCQWLATSLRLSPCTLVSSTNNTSHNYITDISLKAKTLEKHYVIKWLATSRWLSPGTLVSSTNITASNYITEISSKVASKHQSVFYIRINNLQSIIIILHSVTDWWISNGNFIVS